MNSKTFKIISESKKETKIADAEVAVKWKELYENLLLYNRYVRYYLSLISNLQFFFRRAYIYVYVCRFHLY